MKKIHANADDVLGAILGAAILGAAAEQAEATEQSKPDENLERAQALRKQYEAFIEVGFTEDQATAFIAALLN